MQQAADGNPAVPPKNYGRLEWIAKRLDDQFGGAKTNATTTETVRKWFAGETMPRSTTMAQLATILQVDHAWLAVGSASELSSKEQRARNAEAAGLVNVLAGYITMAGGHPAFPEPGDKAAQKARIDLYAVIKGAQYSFHVVAGEQTDSSWRFSVPVEAVDNAMILGAKRISEFEVQFGEMEAEVIKGRGTHKGSAYQVVVTDHTAPGLWKQIKSFAERL